MVEVTGLEPAASWSQTTRATNCATPRSYNLPIIIHVRCLRQAPAAFLDKLLSGSLPVVLLFLQIHRLIGLMKKVIGVHGGMACGQAD